MTFRDRLLDLLGGQTAEPDEPELTGDPCVDEGHDVQETRSAQGTVLVRRCRRCQEWLPDE